MDIIMLLQPQHYPIPEGIEVLVYGNESVIDENRTWHHGQSAHLSGDRKVIANWLRPFDGVWVSENPMLGGWHVVHVKNSHLNDEGCIPAGEACPWRQQCSSAVKGVCNHNMQTNFSCASARAFDLTETPTDEERNSK